MLARRRRSLAVATVAAASVAVAGVSAATAAPGPAAPAAARTAVQTYPLHVRTLTTNVVAPLQLSVSAKRGVLVADNATSLITRIGQQAPVVKGPVPGEVAGVDVNRRGDLAYTFTDAKAKKTGITILRKGHEPVTADLSAFEKKYNPDGTVSYGIDGPVRSCVSGALKAAGIPVSYKGMVDSHPYSVAAVRGGWVVAEAAGNDILFVDNRGHVRLLTLLPRQPHTVSAAEAKALGLPTCVAGVTYNFEPVPTDVEVGRDGALYITTLPGGPEGPALGARGSVYRFTLRSHHLRRLATGFAGATNLAITSSGRILVTEYFAGRISTVSHGHPSTVLSLPNVASVEFYRHAVYAGVTAQAGPNGFTGKGRVVKIDVRW
jgi:hypothetical protein